MRRRDARVSRAGGVVARDADSGDVIDDTGSWLEHAACGLLRTDADGRIRHVNALFCQWVGHDAHALIGRRKIQELFTVGGRIFHQTHWLPLMQLQQSVPEVKFDLLHADGSTVPVVVNGIRRETAGGIVHDLALFVARDRDKYERELLSTGKRMSELAAEATRLEALANDRVLFAEQMIGIVSHDLRNPLAVVEMSAMGVVAMGVSDEQQAALTRIQRATERASRLIRELLDFTQARIGGGLSVQPRSVVLSAVIRHVIDDLQHAFPSSRLHVVPTDDARCSADPDRLAQLLGNLVANAVAYGTRNRPITISSHIDDESCTIRVHNEGAPIAADRLSELFRPMARGHQGPDSGRSIGLGLYIVREIAKAHGGDVHATSSVEGGTTFTVSFPVGAAD